MAERETPSDPRSRTLSPVAARLFKRAQREVRAGTLDTAARTLTNVAALCPNHIEVLRMAGAVARDAGDMEGAVDYFSRAAVLEPTNAELQVDLGIVLFRARHHEEALEHLYEASRLAPTMGSAWYNLGQALQLRGMMSESLGAFKNALEIDACNVNARMSMVRALTSLGRVTEAVTELRQILHDDPMRSDAWFALGDLKTYRLSAEDLRQIALCARKPDLPETDRIRLGFVQAHALEDQGDYAGAWDVLVQSNKAQRRRVVWDATREHEYAERIVEKFRTHTSRAVTGELGRDVIFLVSLPRSGSTLVEQMLAAHPRIVGANEIPELPRLIDAETSRAGCEYPGWVDQFAPRDWERLGREYLVRTAHWRDKDHAVMTDKNLLNWRTLGAALSMLPSARAIVIQRDPVETCLGCFRQWFDRAAPYTYDLDELATVYIDFARLARFWGTKFPNRVFYLQYENLTARPEPALRKLLEFCGLPFDSRCLDFYKTARAVMSIPSAAQVRQPLRRDTARAARYGRQLDHLRARLRGCGVELAMG